MKNKQHIPNSKTIRFGSRLKRVWFCCKCKQTWWVRGMHSDCDGEPSDMVHVNSKTARRGAYIGFLMDFLIEYIENVKLTRS